MAAAQPLKIRMVAGLGNPGEEYAEARHNAGFKAIDELARQAGVTYWKNQAGAEVALININDAEEEGGKRQIVLVKPQSYMNTSGGPISKLCREYKIKAGCFWNDACYIFTDHIPERLLLCLDFGSIFLLGRLFAFDDQKGNQYNDTDK